MTTARPQARSLDELRAQVDTALAGEVDDVLAAHGALAVALDADPASDELRALLAELVQEGAIARLRALERVHDALARLADAGPISEIIERAPTEAATAIELDRVLLSRVDDGWLVAEALHWEGDAKSAEQTLARLRAAPVQIAYPLVEGELLRRRRAAIVTAEDGDPATRQANWEVMRWRDYVAAPVIMEGRVVGFLHGDRAAGAPLGADREALSRFAQGFSDVYERAVLRRRLRVERQELRRIATWADARTAELSDGAIDLAGDRQPADAEDGERPAQAGSDLRDLLTPRELDVLEHLVRGETNADIARSLVVSEGTVKFHVKNILRKMNAANRAEATSRYLRLSLGRDA
jgi:DNA-binding CsgD family transcriptional regulator